MERSKLSLILPPVAGVQVHAVTEAANPMVSPGPGTGMEQVVKNPMQAVAFPVLSSPLPPSPTSTEGAPSPSPSTPRSPRTPRSPDSISRSTSLSAKIGARLGANEPFSLLSRTNTKRSGEVFRDSLFEQYGIGRGEAGKGGASDAVEEEEGEVADVEANSNEAKAPPQVEGDSVAPSSATQAIACLQQCNTRCGTAMKRTKCQACAKCYSRTANFLEPAMVVIGVCAQLRIISNPHSLKQRYEMSSVFAEWCHYDW
jgi:hypothetical protein